MVVPVPEGYSDPQCRQFEVLGMDRKSSQDTYNGKHPWFLVDKDAYTDTYMVWGLILKLDPTRSTRRLLMDPRGFWWRGRKQRKFLKPIRKWTFDCDSWKVGFICMPHKL